MKYLLAALIYAAFKWTEHNWGKMRNRFLMPNKRFPTYNYNTQAREREEALASHLYWRKK